MSCFTSGIDPGWANDLLPFVLTGQCEYIDTVRVMEVVNYATYAQPTVLFDTMGFGQALDATPLLLIPGVLSFAWGGMVKVIAAGLGVEIEELREVHERRPRRRRIDLGFGVVETGTTAAMRFEVQGIVDGEPRIILEHVTRLADDARARVAAAGGPQRLPRHRHRQPELHVRRADDGRRRRPQHRRASSAPRPGSSTRSPRCARPGPACSRCSTCRWSPGAGCCAGSEPMTARSWSRTCTSRTARSTRSAA